MKTFFAALGLALALPLLGCGDGDDVELEPGPATETVPGAAGSMSLDQWDTDPDAFITRAEFDRWWTEEEVASTLDRTGVLPDVNPDGDGEITEQELRDGWFALHDADDSGALDGEEWRAMLTEWRQRQD